LTRGEFIERRTGKLAKARRISITNDSPTSSAQNKVTEQTVVVQNHALDSPILSDFLLRRPMATSSLWTLPRALWAIVVGVSVAIASGAFGLEPPASFLAKLFLIAFLASLLVLVGGQRFFGGRRARRLYLGLVVAGIATLVTLVAGEFLVRFLFRDVTTTDENASYFADRWWTDHPPIKNSLGFREREFSAFPAPDTYRIAIVGDSFTFGQGIPDDARLSNLLEKRLNEGDRSFEVLNFGISGAETIDEIKTLKQFVLPNHPDFVMLQWFVNDIDDHTTAHSRPMPLLPSKTLVQMLRRRSALYYLLNHEWEMLQTSFGGGGDTVLARFREPDGSYARKYAMLLGQFIATVQSSGVPIAILIYPQLADAHGTPADYPEGDVLDFVMHVCADHNITCLDLRQVFAGVEPSMRLWANRMDAHPGRLAHEMVADYVMQMLRPKWERAASAPSGPDSANLVKVVPRNDLQ
jgi:hypothetical protein